MKISTWAKPAHSTSHPSRLEGSPAKSHEQRPRKGRGGEQNDGTRDRKPYPYSDPIMAGPNPSAAMAAAAATPARAWWRPEIPATAAAAAGNCFFRPGAKRL
jgi:hypothetical protein